MSYDQPWGIAPRRRVHRQLYSEDPLINPPISRTSLDIPLNEARCGGCGCILNSRSSGVCNPCHLYLFSFDFMKEGGRVPVRVFQLLKAIAEADLKTAQEWLDTYTEIVK